MKFLVIFAIIASSVYAVPLGGVGVGRDAVQPPIGQIVPVQPPTIVEDLPVFAPIQPPISSAPIPPPLHPTIDVTISINGVNVPPSEYKNLVTIIFHDVEPPTDGFVAIGTDVDTFLTDPKGEFVPIGLDTDFFESPRIPIRTFGNRPNF